MFVQVIKGRTTDAAVLRARGQGWENELRPGAVGYLGGTFGVADDGTFLILARFADDAAAKANSERAEQGVWWEETAKVLDGEVTFRESSDVSTLFGGGSDNATFVQIMEGTVADRAKAEAFETRKGETSAEFAGPQAEYTALFGEMTFTDLRDPHLTGPAS